MKTCRICKEDKPESSFYFRRDSGTYRLECKECLKIDRKLLYNEKKPEILNRVKNYQINNKEKRKQYLLKSKERIRVVRKKRRQANPERFKEADRERYAKNKDRRRQTVKNTYNKYKEAYKLMSALRRSRKRKAQPKWLTEEQKLEIKAIYQKSYDLQKETGQKYHVDHMVPLNGKEICGLHVPWNLQVLTAEENMKKHNNLLEEYLE